MYRLKSLRRKPIENSESCSIKLGPNRKNLYRKWENKSGDEKVKSGSRSKDSSKKERFGCEEQVVLMLSLGQSEDKFLHKDMHSPFSLSLTTFLVLILFLDFFLASPTSGSTFPLYARFLLAS